MKNIVIFGATGMTGLRTMRSAVEKGYKVRIFIRDVSRVPDDLKDKVEMVIGDVVKAEDVDKAVKGMDAVISTLGNRNDLGPSTVISSGLNNIIKAMKKYNLEKISYLSAYTLFDDVPKLPMFHEIQLEHERMYESIKASSLKYIAVFAPYIFDTPKSNYIVLIEKNAGEDISLGVLADFLVDCLNQPEYYGKAIGIANKTN